MVNIDDIYRFYFDIPGQGPTLLKPTNDTLQWKDSKERRTRGYKRSLATKLRFDDQGTSTTDFTVLFNLIRTGQVCSKVPVRVDHACDCPGGGWTNGWYNGFVRLSKGKWNVDECTVELTLEYEDPLQCIWNKWDEEINLYDYGGPTENIDAFQGILQYYECECMLVRPPAGSPLPASFWLDEYGNPQSPQFYFCGGNTTPAQSVSCLPDGYETWTILSHQGCPNVSTGGSGTTGTMCLRTQYVREFSDSVAEPPGDGWVAVTGGWARPAPVTALVSTEETPPTCPCGYILQEGWFYLSGTVVGADAEGNAGQYTNTKNLNDILDDLFIECDLTLVSNFLGLNPDGSEPANDYYTRAATDAQGLRLTGASDVARLDETEAATSFPGSVEGLIKLLQVAFNLELDYDEGDDVARLEHPSYWGNTVQEDFTTTEAKQALIAGRWQFEYDREKQPAKESLKWAAETDGLGGDFDGYPIRYDNICVQDNDETPKETGISTRLGVTNLSSIQGDEDYFDSFQVVLLSTSGGVINSAVVPISEEVRVNGNLALGYLMPRYHDWGRPFRTGYINNELVTMQGINRTRKQAEITVPMACEEYDRYDPRQLIRTQMGAGEIETSTWEDPTNHFTFELLHI